MYAGCVFVKRLQMCPFKNVDDNSRLCSHVKQKKKISQSRTQYNENVIVVTLHQRKCFISFTVHVKRLHADGFNGYLNPVIPFKLI